MEVCYRIQRLTKHRKRRASNGKLEKYSDTSKIFVRLKCIRAWVGEICSYRLTCMCRRILGGIVQVESLREFIVLAKFLNYHKSSVFLNISQSSLSKHIMSLEKDLGFELFERGGGVSLTKAGEAFLSCAQNIIDMLDEQVIYCKNIAKSNSPVRLRWFAEVEYISGLIRVIQEEGKIPISFVESNFRSPLLAPMYTNDVDITLYYDISGTPIEKQAREHGLASMPMGSYRQSIVMMSENPLALSKKLGLSDIQRLRTIVSSNVLYDDNRAILMKYLNFDTSSFVLVTDFINLNTLKYADLGSSMLIIGSDTAHSLFANRDDIRIFDRLDDEPLCLPMCIIYRKNDPNPNARAFVDRTRTFARENKWL
jgi:DNA-binding transcriptional LysR family regulator